MRPAAASSSMRAVACAIACGAESFGPAAAAASAGGLESSCIEAATMPRGACGSSFMPTVSQSPFAASGRSGRRRSRCGARGARAPRPRDRRARRRAPSRARRPGAGRGPRPPSSLPPAARSPPRRQPDRSGSSIIARARSPTTPSGSGGCATERRQRLGRRRGPRTPAEPLYQHPFVSRSSSFPLKSSPPVAFGSDLPKAGGGGRLRSPRRAEVTRSVPETARQEWNRPPDLGSKHGRPRFRSRC